MTQITNSERLYELLPAIHRLRDAREGEPLRALLGVVEQELQRLEDDVAGLYNDWFIETCAEWVVPYIGDLLGVRGLHPVTTSTYSQRAWVANTLTYRRRKGTAPMLEQLARDVTGWPARAVEFFQVLDTTQHLNHLRLGNLRTPDLRDTDRLALIHSPFDTTNRTVDVRHIDNGRGRHNIPQVGLFLWRLQSYPIERVTARLVGVDGSFTWSPLGRDAPLFNQPQTETDITHLAEEINVPAPLRLRPLYDELEARRLAVANGAGPVAQYFGEHPVFAVYLGTLADPYPAVPVPPEQVLICDLSGWQRPPVTKAYPTPSGPLSLPVACAVDPVLGRLTLPVGSMATNVEVSYAYGFSGDLGGGAYEQAGDASAAVIATGDPPWVATVGATLVADGLTTFNTLLDAVAQWQAQRPGTPGSITIVDNRSYLGDLAIPIAAGSQLLIAAADGLRPHVQGTISVTGTAAADTLTTDGLALNGLLIEGDVLIEPGNLGYLNLAHCTVVPRWSLRFSTPDTNCLPVETEAGAMIQCNSRLAVTITSSICGRIELAGLASGAEPTLTITDSIVAGTEFGDLGKPAIAAPTSTATLSAVTVLGTTAVRTIEASNCLFAGAVTARLRQSGCVRFSYVPDGSQAPRRYHCQPELALSLTSDPAEQQRLVASLQPQLSAWAYGDPGYGQLRLTSATEIWQGAADQAEMGAFHFLQQPQREANLRATLAEYLRVGLEAGLFYVT